MPFELEALVGHLYIAGGRAIHTTPPGALVQTAPKNAARGRDVDTFFTLVLPSGRVVPTTFYEQMAHMSAERYFSNTGSVTSALRDVFNTLNHNLHEHNQSGRSHYEAHMICAVLRDDELYIARSGAAVAILRYSGDTFSLPEDLANDEKLFMAPMGTQPIPEVDMKRFIIDSGTRLLLVDASIREVTLARITQALVSKTIEDVLNEFKTLITLQTQLIATEFVIPERKIPVVAAEGEDSRALSETITKARTNIQQEAARTAEARRRQSPFKKIGRRVQQGVGDSAKNAGTGMEALGDVAAKVFKRKQDEKPLIPTSAIITAVIALPLALVIVVVLSWVGGLGETRYDACVENATTNADVARNIEQTQIAAIVNTWEVVLANIAECEAERPSDPVMQSLKREAQTTLDGINNISRREAQLLTLVPGGTIERILMQGTSLYVLDSALDVIYRQQLSTTGVEAASSLDPVINMRAGATVSGLVVGELVDMTLSERNLLALDVNGVLVSCALSLITDCSAQQLNTDLLRNPVAIQVFNQTGNFYVLDSGSNQIWRYQPTNNLYPERPREYFTGTSLPQLVDAIDFAIIQDNGEVYVLYEEGYMTRHRGGESLNFGFSSFPPGQEPSTDINLQAMYVSGNLLPGFYLINRQTRSIFETGLIGTYHATYRVYDESKFELLNAVAIDPAQRLLYAGSGNAIYTLRMDAND